MHSDHGFTLTSLASHSIYEGGGVYCATKFAALAIRSRSTEPGPTLAS